MNILQQVYQITYILICKLSTFIVKVCGRNLFVLLSLRIGKGKCNLNLNVFRFLFVFKLKMCISTFYQGRAWEPKDG